MATATGYEQRLAVLQLSLGGVHGDSVDGTHSTYYDRRTGPYLGELVEGGYVLDKRAVLEARPSLALRSPMLDPKLHPDAIDRLNNSHKTADSFVLHAIANDRGNPASGLAALMMADPDCGGWDHVGVERFVSWWRKEGARVGKRVGDAIVWEDGGEPTPIRPFPTRYTQIDNAPRGD